MDQETMAALTPVYITNTKCPTCQDSMVVSVTPKSWFRKMLGFSDYYCMGCGVARKLSNQNLVMTALTDRDLPTNVSELMGVQPGPAARTTLRVLNGDNDDS